MQELLEKVISLVKEVGLFQMKHFRSEKTGFGEEKLQKEFVSFVDIESEKLLKASLCSILPGSGFFGEETDAERKPTEWIVDPIDGTTNYLSGLPQFAISIALYKNGQPEMGVVYQPATGDLFSSIRGQGLYHNNKPCRPNAPLMDMQDAVIGTGFPYRSQDLYAPFFQCIRELLPKCRGIRRMGSAALDLAYLAAGYLQAFWETDLQPYDYAAGLLFLQESQMQYKIVNDRLLIASFPSIFATFYKTLNLSYTQKDFL